MKKEPKKKKKHGCLTAIIVVIVLFFIFALIPSVGSDSKNEKIFWQGRRIHEKI